VDRRIAVCVFAKPSRPGLVKTRLAPRVGAEGAARLARAFLEDTWRALGALRWARRILATTEIDGSEPVVRGGQVWLQGTGDLGDRLARVLRRALRSSAGAIALGSDSPGLPRMLLEQARAQLRSHDAVLGPCADGGFYLLGLSRCPPGLLRGLRWSAPDTFERTRARLEERGLTTAVLPPWFDVDRPGDLARLSRLISRRAVTAPRTARVLAQSRRR
jgi:rSAM/selenodomain-associated transferase 1